MKNIKQAIRNNELIIGTISICSNPTIIELLGYANFDFVVIDTEHGAAAPSSLELENLIRAAYAADIAPLVRVNEIQQGMIEKALDFGAKGIVIPHVDTVEEAELCVKSAFFPLKGERGAARPVRASRHGWESVEEFLKRSNDETVLIALIETAKSIKNFSQLIEVKEIDAFMYGYFELSLTMGFGGVQNEKTMECEDYFYNLCKQKNKPISDYRNSISEASRVIKKGCKIMAYSVDMVFITEKIKAVAKEIDVNLN
jgi:4-hydroxy-2-oxoheptanedioate aldolase